MLDIIIPIYNPGKYLSGCLQSCFAQTYSEDYKVTLIDDGSTEDLHPYIAPFSSKVDLIRLPYNHGPAYARNVGIKATKGEFILFQDADDYMSENRLALTMDAFKKQPEYVMVCGNFRWIIDGKLTPPCFTSPPEIYYATLLIHFPINTCTVGLRRSILESTGLFDENYPVAEDYDLWMRILKQYPDQIGYIPDEISFYNWCCTEFSLTKKYRRTAEYQQILAKISRKYNAL